MRDEELERAIVVLKELEASDDSYISWFARKLLERIRLMVGFKTLAKYKDAKYVARFVKQDLDSLRSGAAASNEVLKAADVLDALVDEYLTLPDLEDVRDKSAGAVTRDLPGYERFPVGTTVRVASLDELERFRREWTYHHPLQQEQLKFAGTTSRVNKVLYYHGGDVLYNLSDTGSYTWHEQCLKEIP